MRKLVLGLFVLFASISAYCSDTIMPLKVGNTWKFSSSKGKVVYAKVLEKVSMANEQWFKYKEFDDENIYYVKDSKDGQMEILPDTKKKALVFKYPVQKETTYSQFGVKVLVTPNVKVSVPAGDFTAYFYNFDINAPKDKELFYWFVPNLGVVKIFYEGVTYELLEYNIQ